MTAFSWRCPFCDHHAMITDEVYSMEDHDFEHSNKYKRQKLRTTVIVCPNAECKEYSLKATLHNIKWNGAQWVYEAAKESWQLIPAAEMKVFPDYIPAVIVADYKEACLIRDQSPKASATLSRRCLQGMIRDFWGISKPRLIDEIEAIKDKVEPLTWSAIDAVRRIGNIGAHMEKDINLIIDVDSDEASLLIGLIEMLLSDWYVAKHDREQRLTNIIATAGTKDLAKTTTATSAKPTPPNKP